MEVIVVKKDDTTIINFIIANFIDNSDNKPSPNHLQKLLTDDRTYLLAAVADDNIIGFAVAYRFLSFYTSGYLAYLYDIEVLTNYRRKGAGKLLIKHCLSI